MPILTTDDAASALNHSSPAEMPLKVTSILLPAVDQFIKDATGKDWGTLTDTYKTVDPTARMAATMLLIRWFEDSDDIGKAGIGVVGLLGQLQTRALQESQVIL